MIDLHTHTLFSDGVLLPSELIRRAEKKGLRAIALTDHADMSNYDFVIPRVLRACAENSERRGIKAIPGVEITHVPPALIADLVKRSRDLGARIVVVHGETVAEPVEPGTNRAAIEAGVDILAHPGLICDEEAGLAAEKGVLLEITARRGHSITNGHVAAAALRTGASLALNTDAHAPGDLIDAAFARTVALGAGIDEARYEKIRADMARLAGLA